MAGLKRIYVENPESPGAGVYFTGDNAEKEAAEYREAHGVAAEAEADAGDGDNAEKAAPKASTKERAKGENKGA